MGHTTTNRLQDSYRNIWKALLIANKNLNFKCFRQVLNVTFVLSSKSRSISINVSSSTTMVELGK